MFCLLCTCVHVHIFVPWHKYRRRKSKHLYPPSHLTCPIFIFLYGMHGFYFCKLFFPQKWCYMKHLQMFRRLSQTTKNLPRFPFCAFYCIYLFCCSLKNALWNCSIYFLSWKCQCIYVMKMPICMYIFKISIEMIKAVQDWSIIIFDLAFLILPPSVILGFDIYYHPLRFWP